METSQRIPLMIIPLRIAVRASQRFIGLGEWISGYASSLKYDLRETDIKLSDAEYIGVCLLNCLLIFILFFGLFFVLLAVQAKGAVYSLLVSALLAFAISILFFFLLLRYPRILAGKKAEQIDKNLVFALKDLLLQVSSGVSLYNAFVNISNSGYGQVSKDFKSTAQAINTGTPMSKALEKMAVESKSEYLRKTIWQLVNTLKAGASIRGALQNIINDLTIDQRSKISNYAKELNLWSLLYMLFAVAIPTIGSTLMVILSSFAGIGITAQMFITFLVVTFIAQYALIGFVKARRPVVQL